MNDDGICQGVVSEDELIKAFGAMQLEREGDRESPYIPEKMRELGHLVLGIKSVLDNNKTLLADCLKPDMFDIIVAAVKVCGFGGPGRKKVKFLR